VGGRITVVQDIRTVSPAVTKEQFVCINIILKIENRLTGKKDIIHGNESL